MIDLNYLDNKLIICPEDFKDKVFTNMNQSKKLYNIKMISIEQFYTDVTFNISKEMIYYVMKKYNVTVGVAKSYLKSLKDIYYVLDNDNKKYLFLKSILKELINNNLIKDNNLNYYSFQNILVIGYCSIEKKYKIVFDKFENIEIIKTNVYNRKLLQVRKFKTIEDEICFTYEQIIDLLNDEIDINKIKITGVMSDYYFLLNKFSKMFNLPVTILNQKTLFDIKLGKDFLNSILNDTYLDCLNNIKLINPNYYNIIINILNEYTFINDYKLVYPLIVNDFKQAYLNELCSNDIKVVDFDNYNFKDDEYVFLMGLNQGSMPKVIKDEDYLSDVIKEQLGLSTSVDINKNNKIKCVNKIFNITNIYISYACASTFKELQPSTIIKDYGFHVIEENELKYNYSNSYNEYVLTNDIDNFIKYNVTSKSLIDLKNTYKQLEYDNYDNAFKGIDKSKLQDYINNKVKLSYTDLDKYNKCSFSYYIDKILKLNIFEDKFSTKIGTLFHYVLSNAFSKDFDFEKTFEIGVTNSLKEINQKEKFLLIKLKEELKYIIGVIKEQLMSINYTNSLFEHEVKIKINDNCHIEFKGIIDKMFLKEEEDTIYVALIDYKTGDINANINNICYGLNLQLPVYIYLAKKAFSKDVCVTGFYYQTILQNEFKTKNDLEYYNKKQSYIKLQGYTLDINNCDLKFDKTENDSAIIKGLRRNNDGTFSKNSKVLTLLEMKAIERLVESKIIEAGNNIYNGSFDINPKMIGKENESCKYCKYNDLCFKKEQDIQRLSKVENLDFLKEYM